MKRIWFILILGSACQAVQPFVGNIDIYPEIIVQDKRCAERFFMPEDGTIVSLSIYHEGGSGEMLLGLYLGESIPQVRVGVTPRTSVNESEGWQAVALTDPLWIPRGTPIWLAWVFKENSRIRYQAAPAGSVESNQTWNSAMPISFGSSSQVNRVYSIYMTYIRDVHPVINEVVSRNDTLSERQFIDEEWHKHGWIELYNPSNLTVSLDNYYLSNSRDDLQKWALPDIVMGPHKFLRIWTSGKDRTDPNGSLHTSFNLMDSESIYLTYANPEVHIDMLENVTIPADYSYGRYPDGADEWYFYTEPTPWFANTMENRNRFVIDQRHVSLTVGSRFQMTVTPGKEDVVWSSDNPLVWINPAGSVLAVQDAFGEDAKAIITACSADNDCVDSCRVTIVNWVANLSELKVMATPIASYILGTEGENLFYTKNRDLYVTPDGFETSQFLSMLPEDLDIPKMLVTPFGYFVQCNKKIFKSYDLVNWTASYTMNMRSLNHGLTYFWDPVSQTGYVYACEYSTNHDERHRVCRGIFPPILGGEFWETILDFASVNEWQNDPSIQDAARHVHTVIVDPYTGHVWVGTGDGNVNSKLLYSDDNGGSFRVVGMGSQEYRTVSIWFTERYVYWSMDAYSGQSCWRIPRTKFEEGGFWPSMTPELASGTTKPGISYFVTSCESEGNFPVTVGYIYKETEARILDKKNKVRAIDDPQYNYKEKVADLYNGSIWYHLWVRDEQGNPILLLGQSAEGAQRDYRGRVFGIKELPDGGVDVQELLSVGSTNPEVYDSNTMFVQLEPKAQDADGYIYLTGRQTDHRIYKTRLTWVDNPLPH
jgi:hypothetical protein